MREAQTDSSSSSKNKKRGTIVLRHEFLDCVIFNNKERLWGHRSILWVCYTSQLTQTFIENHTDQQTWFERITKKTSTPFDLLSLAELWNGSSWTGSEDSEIWPESTKTNKKTQLVLWKCWILITPSHIPPAEFCANKPCQMFPDKEDKWELCQTGRQVKKKSWGVSRVLGIIIYQIKVEL